MLLVGGTPTGIWPGVSVDKPGGRVAVPGRPPAPLTEIEPEPLHGKPVTGFVPVALPPIAAVEPGSVPGLIGDTAFCARISAGLTVPAGDACAAAKLCASLAAAPSAAPAATRTAASASLSKAFARIAHSSSQPASYSRRFNSLKFNSLKSIASAAPPQRSNGGPAKQFPV